REATNTIMAAMSQLHGLWVLIAAGYSSATTCWLETNPGLSRRVDKPFWELSGFSEQEVFELFSNKVREKTRPPIVFNAFWKYTITKRIKEIYARPGSKPLPLDLARTFLKLLSTS